MRANLVLEREVLREAGRKETEEEYKFSNLSKKVKMDEIVELYAAPHLNVDS